MTPRQQFIALLYGQLAGAVSLRDICATLDSHRTRLYHVGGKVPRRSTLADANTNRSHEVFSGLFAHMTHRIYPMCQNGRGSRRMFAAESAHVVYDSDLGCPVTPAVTAANVNDITAAKEMPVEASATSVFDLGYYDYGWWAKLDAALCRIVTRCKSNTPLIGARELEASGGRDRALRPHRLASPRARSAKNRKNPIAARGARDRRLDKDREEIAAAHQ